MMINNNPVPVAENCEDNQYPGATPAVFQIQKPRTYMYIFSSPGFAHQPCPWLRIKRQRQTGVPPQDTSMVGGPRG